MAGLAVKPAFFVYNIMGYKNEKASRAKSA